MWKHGEGGDLHCCEGVNGEAVDEDQGGAVVLVGGSVGWNEIEELRRMKVAYGRESGNEEFLKLLENVAVVVTVVDYELGGCAVGYRS